jgi:hypothetical protein
MPGFLFTPLARWIVATLIVLVVLGAAYFKGRHDVQVNFDRYKAEIKAVADAQAAKTKQIEAKNTKLLKETQDAYNTKLNNLRTYYGLRITASGGTMPEVSGTTGGVNDYSPDNLPPTPVLASQCAEETLKLYMLQQFERDRQKNME